MRDAIIGIVSKVIQQVVGRFVIGLRGFGLFIADGAQGGEEFFKLLRHGIVL